VEPDNRAGTLAFIVCGGLGEVALRCGRGGPSHRTVADVRIIAPLVAILVAALVETSVRLDDNISPIARRGR